MPESAKRWTPSSIYRRGCALALCAALITPACMAALPTSALANETSAPHARHNVLSTAAMLPVGRSMPGQFIVTFGLHNRGAAPREAAGFTFAIERRDFVQKTLENLRAKVRFRYSETLIGFSAELPPRALRAAREFEKAGHGLMRLEPNRMMTILQSYPADGLDRIDQRTLPLNRIYHRVGDGRGVHVYVIDSGIRASHTQFGGRVRSEQGFDGPGDGYGTGDCEGHGTHIAAIIGGSDYGVARRVTLHPVRVFGCAGRTPTDMVIAGVEWVTKDHRYANPGPAVANMSLGGDLSDDLNEAVQASIDSGVTYVIAAGNDYAGNSCQISPANVADAITVANVDPNTDRRAASSNTGRCVDIFAPGQNIWSADCLSDITLMKRSGTSMAAPHVAGVAALVLQTSPSAKPTEVWDAIYRAASKGTADHQVVGDHRDSPDVLLFWGSEGANAQGAPVALRTQAKLPESQPGLVAWQNQRCPRP
jgi:hypothetical protein